MLDEFKTSVNCTLCYETHLVVWLFISKVLQSLLFVVDTGHIQVYCLKYLIVGNPSFNNIKLLEYFFSLSASAYEIKPIFIILVECLNCHIWIG